MLTGGEAARQEPLRIKTVSLSAPLRGTRVKGESSLDIPPSVDPYKSLGRGGVGFGEGEEKPFFRKVLLPLPNFSPLLDYMKISLYKTIRSS